MGLDITNMLTPSKTPFYGIVPGNSATPLGIVTLPVTFSMRENYRTKYIKFEVANFESLCHATLGRLALAKFMAVPHYVYKLLKMPGKSGVLTFQGDEEVVRLRAGGHRICFNIPRAESFIRSTHGRTAALPVWAGDPDEEGEPLQGADHRGSGTQGDLAAGG
jgi:hypothetical protein